MKIRDIAKMPTVIRFGDRMPSGGIHESLFRSFHIVQKVQEELKRGTPHETLLELMDIMTSDRSITANFNELADPQPGELG